MIVLVDGYNAIRRFEKIGDVEHVGESVRMNFIRRLGMYARMKRKTITELLVVFDGGDFRWPQKEQKGGVVEVYSGFGMTADDWIAQSVTCAKTYEYVVVTNDLALKKRVASFVSLVLGVDQFFELVKEVFRTDKEKVRKDPSVELVEYEGDDGEFENYNKSYVRELMEDSTRDIMMKKVDETEGSLRAVKRVSASKASSKEELRMKRIMKKL